MNSRRTYIQKSLSVHTSAIIFTPLHQGKSASKLTSLIQMRSSSYRATSISFDTSPKSSFSHICLYLARICTIRALRLYAVIQRSTRAHRDIWYLAHVTFLSHLMLLVILNPPEVSDEEFVSPLLCPVTHEVDLVRDCMVESVSASHNKWDGFIRAWTDDLGDFCFGKVGRHFSTLLEDERRFVSMYHDERSQVW
jgi:hypothetical protein